MQNNIFENCIKNCSSERCKTGKLVLECENEILNTTATSLNDKIVTFKQKNKKNCHINTISLSITCLFSLAVFPIGCYYHHTRYCIKKNT